MTDGPAGSAAGLDLGEGAGQPLPELELAATAIRLLVDRGSTVATAESLTGGLVCGALTAIAGASEAVRGGIVAYSARAKAELLGVPEPLLARYGTVNGDVAIAMARGARERFSASYGVATTGVAGPDPTEGHPVGTVHVALVGPDGTVHEALALRGERNEIRLQTVRTVLNLLVRAVREDRAELQRYVTGEQSGRPLPRCQQSQVRWR